MASIDLEEKRANPEVAGLVTPEKLYRKELVLVLNKIMEQQLAKMPLKAREQITDTQISGIQRELRNATTKGLMDRIYAIQVQNPGALADAMKAVGYGIKVEDGAVRIEVDPDDTGLGTGMMGRPITEAEFDKVMV